MASSRWRRFAFFDRSTLSLPDEVYHEFIPSTSNNNNNNNSSSNRKTPSSRTIGEGVIPPVSVLFQDEIAAASVASSSNNDVNANSIYTLNPDHLPPISEYFSVACVSVPLSESLYSAQPLPSSSSHSISNQNPLVSALASYGVGVTTSTTTTTTTIPPTYDTQGRTIFLHPSGPAAASQLKLQNAKKHPKHWNDNDSMWNVPVGSPLVLLFMASRNSNMLHVMDLTMRCNPPNVSNDSGGGGNTGGNAGDALDLTSNKNNNNNSSSNNNLLSEDIANNPDNNSNEDNDEDDQDWEDLDGWRGSMFPFQDGFLSSTSSTKNPSYEQQIIQQHMMESSSLLSSSEQECRGRIVGVAACTSNEDNAHVAVITDHSESVGVCVHIDPHLYLNPQKRIPSSSAISTLNASSSPSSSSSSCTFQPTHVFDSKDKGKPRCVDISTNTTSTTFQHRVAVGTDKGRVLLYSYTYAPPASKSNTTATKTTSATSTSTTNPSSSSSIYTKPQKLILLQEIPPPAAPDSNVIYVVTSLQLSHNKVYVGYTRRSFSSSSNNNKEEEHDSDERMRPTGVCCYNLGKGGKSVESRFDLDGRDVRSGGVCDVDSGTGHLVVARSDGLYAYSSKDRNGVAPIDGSKISMCCLPSHGTFASNSANTSNEEKSEEKNTEISMENNDNLNGTDVSTTLSNYVLIAAKDSKSGRDVVDIYDVNNKLVAFHVLLSPGHKALQSSAVITSVPKKSFSMSAQEPGGRSSAIVVTSGGAIVTLTEKSTASKVSLLTQKNLYSAAITLAYQDPSYSPAAITSLYRSHAEHLYRKGDFESAMDQYISTVGSLEPSHVIYRFLDAPKIPLLAKYLQVLRQKRLATGIHLDLLRTCYLKLNDVAKAEQVGVERTKLGSFGGTDGVGDGGVGGGSGNNGGGVASAVSNLSHNPTEALAMICSFEAPQAAEALVVHGATLARALPRETAGLVLSLCDGTFSPNALADAAGGSPARGAEAALQEAQSASGTATAATTTQTTPTPAEKYPVEWFSYAFLENPKLLRLILTHCNKQKCEMSPSLRRTLLELTLEEWNSARRHGDIEKERVRRNQALTLLTDSYSEEIGNYEALVIVQLAGFTEGEVLLYERLQMAPMLLERYAKDGGERARRQMIAMCRTDPELLRDVLGYFVSMASEKVVEQQEHPNEDESQDSEGEAILDDIQEVLEMARAQGVLPPVQIARILAGEGVGQFSTNEYGQENGRSVPLSVALDYVGSILDDERTKIERLKAEVEEYNNSCNAMESEIGTLLSSRVSAELEENSMAESMDIQGMYDKLKHSLENETDNNIMNSEEEFWREMEQSEDRFETIARFFSRGIIP